MTEAPQETTTPDARVPEPTNVSKDEYETRGQTTVATRRGRRFAPRDTSIPAIDHEGVQVTKEQAESLVKESGGWVFIRPNKEEEE